MEPLADAILVGYSIGDEAFLKTVAGEHEPSGLALGENDEIRNYWLAYLKSMVSHSVRGAAE